MLKIYPVKCDRFLQYGRVLKGYDCNDLLRKMEETPLPKDHTIYISSDPEMEKLKVFSELQNRGFGGIPIQLGYCNGFNVKLNAVEYHRSSEINIAVSNLVLLVGSQDDLNISDLTYDTSKIEAFLVPAGCAVELYATTLHYAPCNAENSGFRDVVVLPRETNQPLDHHDIKEFEDKLLFAKNKWLIAHPESGLDKDGAYIGLTGKNITLSEY